MLSRLALLTLFSVLLSACASSNPLGMSDEQWQQLTPDERKELLLREQQIRAERSKAQQIANNQARELELQRQIEEQKRLDKLYAAPQNGNVIRVNIMGGSFQRDKQHYKIMPQSYTLARGERYEIDIELRDAANGRLRDLPAYLHYRPDGAGVELSLHYQNSSDQLRFLNDGDWQCGSHYQQSLRLDKKELIKLKTYIEYLGGKANRCNRYR
ncbi:hypothetical protein [Thiomicrorhabdus xiamenensis]|uniref:Lipoprotein n=1 Tax=Thiomicrorhabdus xiamenensis TaxID=2739063 RepID=A0A7D4SJE8_9GAMM|nr:hypothetical protein [Thiomicrorhabdus xiamenensis]QKI89899.1 hypothetical protein HQN79_10095 [Thiomicrorhabdus xiamenensis]